MSAGQMNEAIREALVKNVEVNGSGRDTVPSRMKVAIRDEEGKYRGVKDVTVVTYRDPGEVNHVLVVQTEEY